MASSDDEGETFPDAVSDYYFKDGNDEPLSFSNLPVQWDESVSSGTDVGPVFLRGTVDKGLGMFYQQVKAWKYDTLTGNPVISVLSKDNRWIQLQKPRKSYATLIRTILITVHSICFCKSKPEASGKSLWDHLLKVFSVYDVRPSENDLIEHTDLIREAVKRDTTLAKSKFLAAFLGNPRKRKLSDEVVGTATKPSFIVDTNGDLPDDDFITKETEDSESESDDDAEYFDSVCAICDNGGDLLCCEGKCFRSFHATRESEDAQDSKCDSLCLSPEEVKETEKETYVYNCENCRYNLHQCFVCGELGSSDKSSNTEVFRCSAATCGHFYHPKCVAKLLQKDNEAEPQALEKKIAGGDPFMCPAHKCAVCKQTENEKVEQLQFAVCRRCPTSYHRKCIPRSIMFEDEGDDDSMTRAWDGLLPKSRALMYCMKHKMIKALKTPARTFKIRNILHSKTDQPSETPNSKKKAAVSEFASKKKPALHQLKSVQNSSAIKLEGSVKKRAATSSVPVPSKKKKVTDTSNNSLRRSVPTKIKKPSSNDGQPSLGIRLYEYQKGLESNNLDEDDTPATDSKQNMIDDSLQTEVLPPIDEDSKQRILALMKDAASSITLDEVKKYHTGKVPSTHAHSSRVDKSIILARVEGSVEAIHVALKKLEEGCSIEDAMAVCEPGVLDQLMKWKEKLRVYLAPFLHGMRYTSFGRHFTKVEKLEKIVDKLKWYVEDGDTVVDFCCGANDFSLLMKNRLDEMGKKRCMYKNFDITRPKNDFNYKKRDWMTVGRKELPKGSPYIMGLNPPFGKNATLANQFIAHALQFRPKLIVLIVPPETERLDSEKRRNPYDLIWEDADLLAGKSFYLPGSVDVNDKQMEQWNNTPPPLYLWSRQDLTTKHENIARRQGHIPNVQGPPQSNEKKAESGLATVNNEISDDVPTTLNDVPIVNEVKDLEKIEDKAKPDTKRRKKGSLAHVNGGLETKKVPVKKSVQKNSGKKKSRKQDLKIEKHGDNNSREVEVQKPDETRAPSHEVKDQKLDETRASSREIEPQKRAPSREIEPQKLDKIQAPSREDQTQKHKKDQTPSLEDQAQKHYKTCAPSRDIQSQKHEKDQTPSREDQAQKHDKTRAPSRNIQSKKHEKDQTPSREDQAQKHDKTRAPSRDIQSQKLDNKSSRATSRVNEAQKAPAHKDEVSETQDSDFSFVDDVRRDLFDQNLDKKYSTIDESTFSFQNDIGVPLDPHMDRRYNSVNDDSYVSSAYRRPDTANLADSTYLTRHGHGRYSPGYDMVGRGPYFDEMGSRGSGYPVTHHEQGLARYGSLDSTSFNRTISSTVQRYAPNLDELNHTRPNSLGQPGPSAMQRYETRLDEMNHTMNHTRMNSLGQPEPTMGSRSVGNYGIPPGFHQSPPPVFRSDSMGGFATGPYRSYPQQHTSSGGWLNE